MIKKIMIKLSALSILKQTRSLSFLFLLLAATAIFTTGCEENRDTRTPLGGYNVFKDSLESGDGEGVWKRLSENSHDFFDKKYQELKKMDDTIVKYLPPTDHAIARKQAGTVLLKGEVKDGKGLFLEIFDESALKSREEKQDWAVDLGKKGRATFAKIPGVELPKIILSEDGKNAVVDAPGVQIAMVQSQLTPDKTEWFVDLIRSGNIVKNNFAWVDKNNEALTKTVDDLIAEQRREREQLIASLMGFKPKNKEKEK